MKDRYYVGVYWGTRRENATSCAARLRRSVDGLAQIDAALGNWRKKAATKKAAENSTIDWNRLDEVLLTGRNRRDHSGDVIEELGFAFAAWTKDAAGATCSISCLCGASPTRNFSNNFILNLPSEGEALQRICSTTVVLAILELLADCWEPDWGTVASNGYLAAVGPHPGEPLVGWMTYLSAQDTRLASLPVRTVPTSKGSIVVATEEPFSIENPIHRERVEATRAKLAAAGLLKT